MSLPPGFTEGHCGDLACPHRNCSCCDACVSRHEEIVDVWGQCFWIEDPGERLKLRHAMKRDEEKASD